MRSFKFLIKAIVFLLCTGSLYAQNAPDITKLEYYIDIDPGYGLGTQIAITPDSTVNIFEAIDLSTTAPGFHVLGVRAMDENGVWGITHTHRFQVVDKSLNEPLSDVVEVEYFFNTDDGYGQGLNLTAPSDSMIHITPLIDLSSANPGINMMGIRAKDANGHWSATHTHLFHVTETFIEEPLQEVVEVEYFFNTDDGYGQGENISITPDSILHIMPLIDLSSVTPGFNLLGIRAKDAGGHWSSTHTHRFHVADKIYTQTLPDIVEVEYYFNTDDGYGTGINLPITNDSMLHITPLIDLSSANPGINLMGIRAKDTDGHWGVTHTHLFHVTETYIEEPLLDIVEVEYFLNTDDGYGQGESISITPDSILHIMPLIDLSSATPGFNLLGVRAKDAGGHWGATHTHRFHIDDVMHAPLSNIVEIEYFFNNPDPGIGQGLTIPAVPDIYVDTSLIIDLAALAIGPNFMGIRAKDNEGSYSHTYVHYFDMIYPPDTFDFTGGISYCVGQPGVTATLSSSESNVFYVLYKDGLPFDTINGTGTPLVWDNLYHGTYNVMGHFIDTAHVYTYMNGVLTVVENPLPIVTCPADFDVCISVDSLLLTGGTPAGGSYSGTGVNNGYFFPAQLTADDYDITYVFQDLNGCTDSCIFTITVHPLPVVNCPVDFDICINIDSTELTGSLPLGGSYSGPGVTGGYFFPHVAGLGTHTITYTYTDLNSCTNTCQFDITVQPLPVLTCHPDTVVCVNVDSVFLAGALPSGGTYTGTYVSNGYFLPQQAGVGQHILTYTYTDVNYCISSCDFIITVINLPAISCPANFDACVNGDSILLTGATPGGGTYSGTGVSGAYFMPWVAGAGNHIISYTYTDTNGCANICTLEILVHDVPVLNCGPDLDICIEVDSILLTSSLLPPGGTYSGTGVSQNSFYPSLAGFGIHTITYELTDTNNCFVFCTFDIHVHDLPVISVTSNSPVCEGGDIVMTASGGTSYQWSGPAGFSSNMATVNIPNVTLNNAGDYSLTVSDHQCQSDTVIQVEVNKLPDIYIAASSTNVCEGESVNLEAVADTAIASYIWSNGATSSQQTVVPHPPVTGYSVTATTWDNCSNTAELNIYVAPVPVLTIEGEAESCIDKGDGMLTVVITTPTQSPYSYTWFYNNEIYDTSSTLLTTFYLENISAGNYELALEDAFGCSATSSYELEPSMVSCHKGVLVPDIFSPNGDGANDVLYVYGQGFESIHFTVFNRSGKKLFESNDANIGWDGSFNGVMMPQGVYTYILKVVFSNGSEEVLSGDVTLIR